MAYSTPPPGPPSGGYPPPPPGGYPPPGGFPPPGGYSGGPPADAYSYANWGQRAGAYLIDIVPVWILAFIGGIARNSIIDALFALAGLAWVIYNRWITMGRTGQSLGKRTLGIRLISESTGAPVGAGMAFVRDIAHIVDSIICYIGWLFPLWDSKAQTLADKIMSTVVVPA